MDYAKFLGKTEETVLAYLGGPHAYGKERRVRVDEPRPSFGFHRFELKGRNGRALEAVEPPPFDGLPRARGHLVAGWLISNDLTTKAEPIRLLPAEEPMPFAVTRARRWHSDDLIFEAFDFDGDIEEAARLRLEQNQPLGTLKGVPSTLRTAYGLALTMKIGRAMHTPVTVLEALPVAARVAENGEAAARPWLVAIAAERAEHAERARIQRIIGGRAPMTAYRANPRHQPTLANAAERAEAALEAAEARMLSCRNLGVTLEVTFEFMRERFISVVDAMTLHVYDSGVCLAGSDELVTLDSLPGVIREAIRTGRLVITRH